MRELEGLLSYTGDGRVIWTSSITAHSRSFDINDWQGILWYVDVYANIQHNLIFIYYSKEPYESSKWACDLISIASSERFQKEETRIASFTTSPGIVASEIGELPVWVVKARILVHYIVS